MSGRHAQPCGLRPEIAVVRQQDSARNRRRRQEMRVNPSQTCSGETMPTCEFQYFVICSHGQTPATGNSRPFVGPAQRGEQLGAAQRDQPRRPAWTTAVLSVNPLTRWLRVFPDIARRPAALSR